MSENKIDFEKSLAALEEIVAKLEGGECSLDESIKLFEQGVKYTSECRDALKNAKERIINLTDLEKEVNDD